MNNLDTELLHFGIKRRSGRYPYGSGDRPFQSIKSAAKRKALTKAVKRKIRDTAREKADVDKRAGKTASSEYKEAERIKAERRRTKRNVRSLSDAELKKSIERLRDEKTLKDLIDDDTNPTLKTAKQITNEAAKTVGKEVMTGTMRYVLRSSMKEEKMTLADLADTIWPKKEQKKKKQDDD